MLPKPLKLVEDSEGSITKKTCNAKLATVTSLYQRVMLSPADVYVSISMYSEYPSSAISAIISLAFIPHLIPFRMENSFASMLSGNNRQKMQTAARIRFISHLQIINQIK